MDTDKKAKRPPQKSGFLRFLLLLAFVGGALAFFLPKISTLESIFEVVRTMPVWIVGLAFLSQTCSYLGSSYMLMAIMNRTVHRLSTVRGILITMAAANLGLVAGWVSSAAATAYWVSKDSDDMGEAALSGILPPLFNLLMLMIVTLFGMVYLLVNHDLSETQIVLYGLILIVNLASMLLAVYGYRHQDNFKGLVIGTVRKLNHLLKRRGNLAELGGKIDGAFDGMRKLDRDSWRKVALGSMMNIAFDILTLYTFFRAADYPIKAGVLIAGYSVAFLISRGAFFIPGGVGIIEGGMTAIYMGLGVTSHVSLVAVLGYRLLSFWLPALFGFLAMFYLRRFPGREEGDN